MEKHQSNTQQPKKTSSRRERQRNKRHLHINAAKALFGDKCQDCGYDEHWEILEFHHAIPRAITGRLPVSHVKNWSWENFRDELLEHCVLLCPTCHKARHLTEEDDSSKFTNETDF